MSIEANLASIAKSLETIAAVIAQRTVPVQEVVKAEVVKGNVVMEPVAVQPVPTPVAPAMVTPVVVAAPVVTATASPSSPVFANHPAFVEFVMNAYKALGPIKGAAIQEVLSAVGVKNINDVKPEMYAAIKSGVEALK